METYSLEIERTVGYKDEHFRISRILELPFAPFEGLILTDGTLDLDEEELHEIRWLHTDRKFWAILRDRYDIDMDGVSPRDYYAGNGWTVTEP